jgi:hypothetical protein
MVGGAGIHGVVKILAKPPNVTAIRGVVGLSGPNIFHFNNDNQSNAADFAQFWARFGLMI